MSIYWISQDALKSTQDVAGSALPGAPVITNRRVRTRFAPVRRTTTGVLRRLADKIEPGRTT